MFEKDQVMYYPFGYEHYLKHSRQEEGVSPSALVQAEDQALIAGMRAVPKGERHRLREYGTEELYLDWRMRLAEEPLEAAREKVELLWERWTRAYESFDESEEVQELEQLLETAWQEWTEQCLEWWEIYQQEMYEVQETAKES